MECGKIRNRRHLEIDNQSIHRRNANSSDYYDQSLPRKPSGKIKGRKEACHYYCHQLIWRNCL